MKKENKVAKMVKEIAVASARNAVNKKHEPEVPEFVQKYMEKKGK